MRQFEVYRNPSSISREFAPFLMVVQSHHLNALATVIVAPLISDSARPFSPVDLAIPFDGRAFTLSMGELGSVERISLKRPAGDLSEHEDAIRRALDRLFSGF